MVIEYEDSGLRLELGEGERVAWVTQEGDANLFLALEECELAWLVDAATAALHEVRATRVLMEAQREA